jgi:diaminopimelate decarboxylase/aspartate kinase
LGGGIPIKEKLNEDNFDFNKFQDSLNKIKKDFLDYEMWLEPGRYIVGESGVILSHVTQTKKKQKHFYIGLGIGMNVLIRPPLYDAYHEIINLTKYKEKNKIIASIVGPICESGDKLGKDRNLPYTNEGDVMLIANAGAYVRSMSSNYNLRDIPKELLL